MNADLIACTIACRMESPSPGTIAVLRAAAGDEIVRIDIREAGSDPQLREWDDLRQNYLQWPGPDGRLLVIEATVVIALSPQVRQQMPTRARVGAPLSLLGDGSHLVILRIRSGKVDLLIDGRLCDEEWLCGGLPELPVACDGVTIEPQWFADAELGVVPEQGVVAGTLTGSTMQYWTPPGHNRWLGDTMMFQDGERLHVFYLIDRRHHGCKGGAGAHQIAHLSTVDLQTWQAHPLAVEIEEPWEVLGTGGVVRQDGRWHLLYGLHTDRVVERTMLDARGYPSWSRSATESGSLPCAFAQLDGLPQGTAMAVSDDGVHFRKTGELVHRAQNPGVCAMPSGGFALFAGYGAEGLYRSDDLRLWQLADAAIVPHGEGAPARNSTECIGHLAWGEWHYLFGGRTGFWMARDFAGPYWDHGNSTTAIAQPRWDIYDGLWVPMVAALADGRRILSGWLEDRGGWAGCLVLRELRQEADGTLAMCWPAETLPVKSITADLDWGSDTWPRRLTAADGAMWMSAEGPDGEYVGEFTLTPGSDAGIVALIVGGSGDLIDGCELRLDARRRRAQWSTPAHGRSAPEIPDPAEVYATPDGQRPVFQQVSPHLPFHGGDFAITAVEGLERTLTVRLRVMPDRKSGSTIIDAEINGQRTMITRRRGLVGRRLHLVAVAGSVEFARPVIRVPMPAGTGA